MRIHHFSIPARDPERVAGVLAELLGARVVPLPHPRGTLLVYAGDSDGSAIEVWLVRAAGGVGDVCDHPQRDSTLPEAWPHHAYVTSDACDPDAVVALFARKAFDRPRRRTTVRPTPASGWCAAGSRTTPQSRSAAARCARNTNARCARRPRGAADTTRRSRSRA